MLLATKGVLLLLGLLPVLESDVGTISGTVRDVNDVLISNALITLSSTTISRREKSVDGTFRFNVPAGEYQMKVTGGTFLPYRRAPVTVFAKANTTIRVRTIPPVESDQTAWKESVIDEKAVTILGSKISLRYDRVQRSKVQTVYSGSHTMLTWQDVSVYSREIICRQAEGQCSTQGSSTVDVGATTYHAKSVLIDLRSRQVRVSPEKTIAVR